MSVLFMESMRGAVIQTYLMSQNRLLRHEWRYDRFAAAKVFALQSRARVGIRISVREYLERFSAVPCLLAVLYSLYLRKDDYRQQCSLEESRGNPKTTAYDTTN